MDGRRAGHVIKFDTFLRSGYPSGCSLTWECIIQDGRREGVVYNYSYH